MWGSEDGALARRAAAGDGRAFATLYERHERRAFNLCYRITGSYEDAADATQEAFLGVLERLPRLEGRELVFHSYLLTAARNASYDVIARSKRAEPGEIAESAVPVGADVPPPTADPDRNALLDAQQEEIREANLTLPERQREALALRELEELSYDEIAEIMEMNRNSVAQLISRARIGLRDSLRGTALASIATSSVECERALPLLAMRDDAQLDDDSADAAWLRRHLAHCGTCRVSQEAMQEAGASYRSWAPIAAAPWLLRETVAKAAEQVGGDWSGEPGGRPPRPWRRDALAAGALAVALVLVALPATGHDDTPQLGPASLSSSPVDRSSAAHGTPGKPVKRKAGGLKGAGEAAPAGDGDQSADGDGSAASGSKRSEQASRNQPAAPGSVPGTPSSPAASGPAAGAPTGSSPTAPLPGSTPTDPPARPEPPPPRERPERCYGPRGNPIPCPSR